MRLADKMRLEQKIIEDKYRSREAKYFLEYVEKEVRLQIEMGNESCTLEDFSSSLSSGFTENEALHILKQEGFVVDRDLFDQVTVSW